MTLSLYLYIYYKLYSVKSLSLLVRFFFSFFYILILKGTAWSWDIGAFSNLSPNNLENLSYMAVMIFSLHLWEIMYLSNMYIKTCLSKYLIFRHSCSLCNVFSLRISFDFMVFLRSNFASFAFWVLDTCCLDKPFLFACRFISEYRFDISKLEPLVAKVCMLYATLKNTFLC